MTVNRKFLDMLGHDFTSSDHCERCGAEENESPASFMPCTGSFDGVNAMTTDKKLEIAIKALRAIAESAIGAGNIRRIAIMALAQIEGK